MANPTPPFNNNLRGPIGQQGQPGRSGIKGDKGDRGAVGPKGDKGDRGDKGDPGRSGTQGIKGESGSAGGMQDPGSNGILVRIADNITVARTIQAGNATVLVTNGNGVAGDPTITGNYQAGSGISITGNIITSLAGGGTVTSVSGVSPIVITGTPTVNPTVTIQGSIVSGAVVTTAQNLGLLTTGLLKGTVSAGVNTISTAISGTDYQPPGAYVTGLTTDVVATGPGNVVATIQPHVVIYNKMQQASTVTLLGNPTGSLANISEITLGTGLAFSGTTLNVTSATWTLAGVMVVAVDGVNGNDANTGFAISPDLTQANVAIATIAAGGTNGVNAKQTLAGAAAIIPQNLAGRTVYVIVSGGTGSGLTYTDPWTVFDRNGGTVVIYATGTNTTAGATAFTGTTNDLICQGAQTSTGMNVAGYNPVGSTTSQTIQLAKVGGGSPSFGAEPGKPLFVRARFDNATTTVAQRNKVYTVVAVTGADTITITSSIAFVTSDTLYLEDPGPVAPGGTLFGNSILNLSGVQTSSSLSQVGAGTTTLSFVQIAGSLNWAASGIVTANTLAIATPQPSVGPVRVSAALTATSGQVNFSSASFACSTTATLSGLSSLTFSSYNYVGSNVSLTGINSPTYASTASFGSIVIPAGIVDVRVGGSLTIQGSRVSIGTVSLPSTSQTFGVKVIGTNDIAFLGPLSGGTKTKAGFDMSLSVNSRFSIFTVNSSGTFGSTLTGTFGDIYYGGDVFVTNNPYLGNLAVYLPYTGLDVVAGSLKLPNGDQWNVLTTQVSSALPSYSSWGNPAVAISATNFGSGAIASESIVVFQRTDARGVINALADNIADVSGTIGISLGIGSAPAAGFVVVSGTVFTAPATGGSPIYVSASTPGAGVVTPPSPPNVIRQVGWMVSGSHMSLSPDNNPTYYQTVKNNAAALTQRTSLRFDGTTLIATDVGSPNYWTSVSVGTVPISSVTAPTGTGFAHVTSGAWDSAAVPIDSTLVISTGTLGRSAISGDGTISAGSNTFALSNIPTGTIAAGNINFSPIIAPATPSAGHALIYVDSTSLNIAIKNASGVVNHGIQSNSGTASKWVSAINNDGSVTLTQPAYTDISGPIPAITSLTGDVTGTGPGATATTIGANKVTYAKIQQVSAVSVLGNPTGSTANVSEITATADGQILQRAGGVLTFATLSSGSIGTWPTGVLEGASGALTSVSIGANQIAYGSGSAGGLTSTSNMTYTSGAINIATVDGNGSSIVLSGGSTNQAIIKGAGTGSFTFGTLGSGSVILNTGSFPRMSFTNTGTMRLNQLTGPGFLQTDSSGFVSVATVTSPLALSGGNLILNYDASSLVLSGGTTLTRAALTGDVTATIGSNSTTITNNAVTYAKIQQVSAVSLLGNPTGSTANVSQITLGSGLSFSGTTLIATGSGGTITGVTATSPIFSSGGATPNITIQGSIVSGSTSTSAQNLGSLSTGILFGTVSTGVNTIGTLTVGSGLNLTGSTLTATGSGGSVTVVTGTAPIFITSVAAATPNVTIQGSVVTGSTSTTAQNLGGLSNGTLQQTISAGIATISAFNGADGSIPFYAGGSGQLDQNNGNFFWDNGNERLGIGTSSPTAPLTINSGSGTVIAITTSGGQNILKTNGGLGILTGGADSLTFGTNGTARAAIDSSGNVTIASLTAGGLVKAAVTSGQLGLAVAGTDYQVPVVAGAFITITGGNIINAPFVGKVWTDATDAASNVPDYLYNKLTSFTNTISFSPIGSGDRQVTIDVVPGQYCASYKWSINYLASGGILANTATVVIPADTGSALTASGGFYPVGGGTVPALVQNVYGTSGSANTYRTHQAYTAGTLILDIPFVSTLAGSGTAVCEIALWYSTDLTNTGAYTQVASTTFSQGAGLAVSRTPAAIPFSVSVPADSHFFISVRRTDSATLNVIGQLFLTAVVEFQR